MRRTALGWPDGSRPPGPYPQAGRIAFDVFQLRLAEQPELLMVMQVPASDDDLDRVTSLLGPA